MSKPLETLPSQSRKDKASDQIAAAWVMGTISGFLTLIASLSGGSGHPIFPGFDYDNLIDVVIIFGLTFGIYKKNRIAAILMLSYFVVNEIFIISNPEQFHIPISAAFSLGSFVFGFCYLLGVIGTFVHHKIVKSEEHFS
jgi:hypothetical protein